MGCLEGELEALKMLLRDYIGNPNEHLKQLLKGGEWASKVAIMATTPLRDKVGLAQMIKGGAWMPPQGDIGDDETIEDAARRVLLAEMGVEAVEVFPPLRYCPRVLPRERKLPDTRSGKLMNWVLVHVDGILPDHHHPSIQARKFVSMDSVMSCMYQASRGKRDQVLGIMECIRYLPLVHSGATPVVPQQAAA